MILFGVGELFYDLDILSICVFVVVLRSVMVDNDFRDDYIYRVDRCGLCVIVDY